jgi:uncharacterized protein YndB with AHSA1/START domain
VSQESNASAPVLGHSEIEIAAPPELVWEVLATIERWPDWNPAVKSVSMQDGLTEGSRFRWKAGPGTITSTLHRVEPPRLIAWTGRTFGIKANHVYTLEPRNGQTFVTTEESYDGLVSHLFRRTLQKTLDKALAEGLAYLKAEAERRSRA